MIDDTDDVDPVLRHVAAAPPREPPASSRLAPGDKLGPYEIRALLGTGGMAVVYRARDTRLGRDVAVKVLPAALASPRWRARFEREARAVAAIQHANVIAIHDVGEHEGVPYLVCELLEGETLREPLTRGAIAVDRAIAVAQQVARGLSAAHALRVVHRDLKPENLFVTRDGTVKILDFGLARTELASDGVAAAPRPETLTNEGVVVGTMGYMAPEQLVGKKADHRADLFALGVVMYEMLAGREPFARPTAAEVAAAIMRDDPPPLSDVPAALAAIVRRCLAKDPKERFDSARDLLFSLEQSTSSAPDEPRHDLRHRWMIPAAALVAVLAAAFVAVDGAGSAVPARAEPTFQKPTFGPNVDRGRLLSDGRSFVFVPWRQGNPLGVSLGRIGKTEATLLIPGALLAAVSPSDELAILRSPRFRSWPVHFGTLARLDVAGGEPRDVATDVSAADFSPDGRELVLARQQDTRYILELGGEVLYESTSALGHVRFAPDGRHVAFIEFPQLGNDSGWITVVDRRGDHRRLTPRYTEVGPLAWSPDGTELFYSASEENAKRILAVTLDGTRRVILAGPDHLDIQDVARDGRLLVVRNATRAYWLSKAPDATAETVVSLSEWDTVADISRDGRMLAIEAAGLGKDRQERVFVAPTDGSPATFIGLGSTPRFSPDGKTLVAVSVASPGSLSLLPIGPGRERTLPAGGLVERWYPTFAGANRVVSVGIEPGHARRIYVQDLAGGDPRPISPDGWTLVRWRAASPMGGEVLAKYQDDFYIIPIDGGVPRHLDGIRPHFSVNGWTAEGDALWLVGSDDSRAVVRLDLATGTRTQVMPRFGSAIELGGGPLGGYAGVLSPRGDAWAYRVVGGPSDLFMVTSPGLQLRDDGARR